jgi:hypothetical protein
MSNSNFKGRQKGSTKKTSLIEDPILNNYKILFDEYSYNLIFIDPDTKKEKVLGYYTQLPKLLFDVSKHELVGKKESYSIKEYISNLEKNFNNLKTLINI